jgi:hypothetical protein
MQVGAVLCARAKTAEEECRQTGGGPVVDTLNLSLNDFEIAPSAQLCVQPHSYQADTGVISNNRPLWIDTDGRPVEGRDAKHVAERFTVIIKVPYPGAPASLYVQFSLPKFCSGNNFAPIGLQEFQAAMLRLERELRERGIRASLLSANMSWLHLFRNILTDEVFAAYAPFLRQVKPSRQLQCKFGPTFVWKNTQQETVIYDKIAEMRHRGYDVSVYPANTTRCELRLLNGHKIESVLGGRTVETLCREYSNLGDIYNNAIRKTFFKTPIPDDDMFVGSQMEKEMRAFKKTHSRNWVQPYLQAQGAITLRERYGDELFHDTLAKSFEGGGNERSTQQRLYRLKRDMNRGVSELESLRAASPSSRTLGALRRELESKLLVA